MYLTLRKTRLTRAAAMLAALLMLVGTFTATHAHDTVAAEPDCAACTWATYPAAVGCMSASVAPPLPCRPVMPDGRTLASAVGWPEFEPRAPPRS